jgi:hypothetical protein
MKNNAFVDSSAVANGLKDRRKKFLEGTYSPPSALSPAPALYEVGAQIMFPISNIPVVSGSVKLDLADEYAVNVVELLIKNWLRLGSAFSISNLFEYNRKSGSNISSTDVNDVYIDFVKNKYYLDSDTIDFFATKCVERLELWLEIWVTQGSLDGEIAAVQEKKNLEEDNLEAVGIENAIAIYEKINPYKHNRNGNAWEPTTFPGIIKK